MRVKLPHIASIREYRARVEALDKLWEEERAARGYQRGCYSGGVFATSLKTKPAHGDTWGNFQLRRDNWTLECNQPGCGIYYLDLERCTSAGQVLDWIFQISNKGWMTGKDKADLIDAIEDILHPQANLCSFGHNLIVKDIVPLLKKRTTARVEITREKEFSEVA